MTPLTMFLSMAEMEKVFVNIPVSYYVIMSLMTKMLLLPFFNTCHIRTIQMLSSKWKLS